MKLNNVTEMIVQRDKEITDFVKKPFYKLKLDNGAEWFDKTRDYFTERSEAETIKLALADKDDDLQDFFNSPEYIQSKKELDQINMMFGDYKSENGKGDLTDLIPALTQGDEKLSPQAMQMIMMQSVMPDIINIDGNNSL